MGDCHSQPAQKRNRDRVIKVCISLYPQYQHTDCPNWSLYISIKKNLREFGKRSKHFSPGDHFINSHNLFSSLCTDIVGRKLMLVTVGT